MPDTTPKPRAIDIPQQSATPKPVSIDVPPDSQTVVQPIDASPEAPRLTVYTTADLNTQYQTVARAQSNLAIALSNLDKMIYSVYRSGGQ